MSKAKLAPKEASDDNGPDRQDAALFQSNLFVMMVANMTWQLAVVVIVPIVGGYYLDQYFHTFPGLMIAGFLVAALGVVGVMLRILKDASKQAGFKK